MFSLAGFENVRLVNDEEADSLPLGQDDWKEDLGSEEATQILPPIPSIHVQFSIENCKLALLG